MRLAQPVAAVCAVQQAAEISLFGSLEQKVGRCVLLIRVASLLGYVAPWGRGDRATAPQGKYLQEEIIIIIYFHWQILHDV